MIICYTVTKTWQATGVIIIIYSFWTIFCPFTLPTPNSPKNQNKKKMKIKRLEIPSFYTSVPKIIIIRYTIPEIKRGADGTVIFHFGLFFSLLPL